MIAPLAPLHAGHGDPVPGALLGVTFGAAVAVSHLADRDSAPNYVADAVLSFLTAYAVVETSPHTNLLADAPSSRRSRWPSRSSTSPWPRAGRARASGTSTPASCCT